MLGLSGGRDDYGYVRFYRAVYSVIRALAAGERLTRDDAVARLDDAWTRIGPEGHPFEALYRRQAERLIDGALKRWDGIDAEPVEWEVERPNGTILLRPDLVERRGGELVVQRLRTGRAPKKVPDDDIYALYHAAARQQAEPTRVQVVYLGSDTALDVPMTERVIANRLAKYDEAMAAIAGGSFPAKADDRTCPRCPQYFVCPSPL